VRGHGLRRARYRRFAKVDLQNQFIAVACDIKSWFQKLQGTIFAARKEEAALNVGSLEKVLASFFYADQLVQLLRNLKSSYPLTDARSVHEGLLSE
jgi:hypothetical protein